MKKLNSILLGAIMAGTFVGASAETCPNPNTITWSDSSKTWVTSAAPIHGSNFMFERDMSSPPTKLDNPKVIFQGAKIFPGTTYYPSVSCSYTISGSNSSATQSVTFEVGFNHVNPYPASSYWVEYLCGLYSRLPLPSKDVSYCAFALDGEAHKLIP